MNFQTFIFFAPKSREVTSQNRLYLKNNLPESNFSFTRRRRIDVWRVMPSFMSISARVQELFRENRGGGGAENAPPPRRLRVNYLRTVVNDLLISIPLSCPASGPDCRAICQMGKTKASIIIFFTSSGRDRANFATPPPPIVA